MPRVLIGDGFDFEFTTKPTDRTPDPITIKYRPPSPESIARLDKLAFADAKEIASGQAEFFAENIGEWNVVDGKDQPIPVSKEVFLKIRDWNLLRQLREEICRSNDKAAEATKK